MKLASILIIISSAFIAPIAQSDLIDDLPLGLIYSVNYKKDTITVTNVNTGNRHTYFINERSKISSKGKELSLNELKPGHAVALDFKRTEAGRVVDFLRVPQLDQINDLPELSITDDIFMSGVVTGVRAKQGYLVIRGPRIHLRMSLLVPDKASLSLAGEPISLADVKVNDLIEATFRETVEGFVLVSANVKRQVTS